MQVILVVDMLCIGAKEFQEFLTGIGAQRVRGSECPFNDKNCWLQP